MDTGDNLERLCYLALNSGNKYVPKWSVFKQFEQMLRKAPSKVGLKVLPKEIEVFIADYEKKFEGTWEFAPVSEWLAALENYASKYDEMKNVASNNRLTLLSGVLESVQKIINSNPAVFLPYTNENRRKIVRLFKDGKNSFAMIDELEHALNGTTYKTNPLANWDTVDFKTVLEMTRGQNVELLVTPIRRDERSIVNPIRTPIGTSCKLAVDIFMSVIHVTPFIPNIFKWNCYKMKLSKLVAWIREYFPADKREQFFMTEQTGDMILKKTRDEFMELINYIIKYRVKTYEHSVLRFMGMFPEMMQFYHNQKQCEVVRLKNCRWCPKDVEVKEEKPTFEEEAMEMLEELEKEAGKLMCKRMKRMRQKASKRGTSESDSSSESEKMTKPETLLTNGKIQRSQVFDVSRKTAVAPITCNRDIRSTTAPKQNKQGLAPTSAPNAQKQSNRCDFCPKTSEKCQKVSGKLKTMINQNKKLDEELKELEAKEAEKPREELESELEEKLKRIHELREQNKILKASKNELEPRINGLEENVGACRGQIRVGISLNEAKDAHIRVLKQHVPSDVLSRINERFGNMRL